MVKIDMAIPILKMGFQKGMRQTVGVSFLPRLAAAAARACALATKWKAEASGRPRSSTPTTSSIDPGAGDRSVGLVKPRKNQRLHRRHSRTDFEARYMALQNQLLFAQSTIGELEREIAALRLMVIGKPPREWLTVSEAARSGRTIDRDHRLLG